MTEVRRRLFFSVTLAAVALSFLLLFPGGVTGISLSIEDNEPAGGYLLGSTIELSGSVALNDDEFVQVQNVGVVIDGPQPCTATLPLDEGTNQVVDCSPAGSGELSIDVEYSNVAYGFGFLGYGYGYGYGYGFNGVGDSAVIDYTVNWTPPIFLDPAPEYTLLPATGPSFDIPQITIPERDPNLPDDMPAITSLFAIPPIESVDPDAPDGLPSLEILANRIPLATSGDPDPAEMPTLTALANDIPTATSGTPEIAALGTITALANEIPLATEVDENDTFLEESTALANAIPLATSGTPDPAALPTPTEVGSIPDVSPSLPTGVSALPTVAEAFDITTVTSLLGINSQTIRGLASDGTDFFVVLDDTPTEDVVIKVDSSGDVDTTFGNGGQVALPDAGQGGQNFRAITWLNNRLYVADGDEICTHQCARKIFVLNDSSGAQTSSFTIPDSKQITGLTVDDGDIVGITESHCELVVFDSNGNHEQNISSDDCGNPTNALAAGFFTAMSGTVHSVSASADRGTSYSTSPALSSIRGAVVVSDVLYLGDSDGKVYKTAGPSGVTTSPTGMTFDGTYLWVITDNDAGGLDTLLKLSATDGSLVSSYDAPSAYARGLTFLDDSLWVFYYDDSNANHPKFVEVNEETGAVIGSAKSPGCCYSSYGGMSTDGEDVFLMTSSNDGWRARVKSFKTSNGSGAGVDTEISGADNADPELNNGVNALTYRSSKAQWYGAKDGELVAMDSSFSDIDGMAWDIEVDSADLEIMGLAFDDDNSVVYMVDDLNDKIYKASIPSGETTDPVALAFGGGYLWVVTDGEMGEDKILKLNSSTGALEASMNAPNDSIVGMAYLENALWLAYNDGNTPKVVEVNPTTGAYDLGDAFTVPFGGGCCSEVSGLTQDGEELIAQGNGRQVVSFDTEGDEGDLESTDFECCDQENGVNGFAYRTAKDQFFRAKDEELIAWDSTLNVISDFQFDMESDSEEMDIMGVAFDNTNDVIYIADDETDYIYTALMPTGETQNPKAMAYDGTNLWLITEGTAGTDKLLKLNADTGALVSSYDAPNDDTVGMTYADGQLWVAYTSETCCSGDQSSFVAVDPSDGSFDLGDAETYELDGYNLVGGALTHNGTVFVAFGGSEGRTYSFDDGGDQDGPFNNQDADALNSGADALAYRSAKSQYFAAKNETLQAFSSGMSSVSSMEWDLTSDGTTELEITALTFNNTDDIIYIADNETDYIYRASLPTGETTNPKAMAHDGTNLWLVTEGEAGNDKILKLNADTGALVSSFDAPNDGTLGMTYFENALWINYVTESQHGGDDNKFVEVNPTSGLYDLGDATDVPMDGCCPLTAGGLTNNGNQLVAIGDGEGRVVSFDTQGDKEGPYNNQDLDGGPFSNGSKNLAYRSAKTQYFVGKDDRLGAYNSDLSSISSFSWDLTSDGTTPLDIQALTFDNTNDVIYVADDETDKIFIASLPRGETTNPKALTYDGTNLWLVTQGEAGNDKILKLDADTGALVSSFDAPSDETFGLAYWENSLWYSYKASTCCSGDVAKVVEVNPTTGDYDLGQAVEVQMHGHNLYPGGLTSVNKGGDSYLIAVGDGEGKISSFDGDGNQEGPYDSDHLEGGSFGNGADSVAFRSSKSQYFLGIDDQLGAYNTGKSSIDRLEFSGLVGVDQLGDPLALEIQGLTFVGDVIYIADDATDAIYRASIPPPDSNPRGMTTDGESLYILVDGDSGDNIIKTDLDGNLVTAFGVSGIQETVSAETSAISYSNQDGRLYVSYVQADCCGHDEHYIVPVSATTGAADTNDEFRLENIPGFGGNLPPMGGLAALDDMLLLGFNGPSYVPGVDLDGDFRDDGSASYSGGSGKTAMAVRSLSTGVVEVLVADGSEIGQWEFQAMTQNIPAMESWDLPIGDVQGMTIIDKVIYLAEDTTDTIFVAAIPDPEVNITQTPTGMASDDTNLYAVVDASPKDWVAVLSPAGTLISSFMAPADNIGGITVFDDSIWLGGEQGDDCPPFCNEPGAKVYKLNASGVLQATYNIEFQGGEKGDITGMSYMDPGDGGSIELIVANANHHGWFNYEVDYLDDDGNSANNPMQTVYAQGGGGQTGFQSLLYVSELEGVVALKHTGGGSKLIVFDDEGNGTGQSDMLQSAPHVVGLAYVDVSCSQSPAECSFLFLADGNNEEVREAVFDTNVPEPSTYGDYTAQLTTIYNSSVDAEDPQTTTINSSEESFSLVKATSVDIAITSPATGVTVDSSPIEVSFTVDDPSVTQVILGAELATGEVFGDSADDGEVSENKWEITNSDDEVGWHIDCDGKVMSAPCSWHYAKDVFKDGDYDSNGEANNGTLNIAEGITVKSGTALQFSTWYNTETFPAYDQKWVEVDIQGDDEDDSGWLAIAQIIAPGETADQPDNAHSSYFTKSIQSANAMFQPAQFGVGGCPPYCEPTFAPIWEPVFIDLEAAFEEDTELDIRFRFDTIDGAVNQMEGWYIDNVSITGESSAASASATVEDGVASFEIAEGSNSITLQAVIPYDNTVTDADTIIVFLDTIEPLITMDQDVVEDPEVPDVITASTVYTVTGGFEELNATFLQMKVTTVVGTKTPYVDKSPSATGSFEIDVVLAEGDNLVTVEVTDGAGRIGSASALIFLDTMGPTYTPLGTVYPVGVTSARPGDPIIFQINAGDAASDVRCVEVIFDNQVAEDNEPCQGEQVDEHGNVGVAPFVRPEDIPEAVRDSWGATGEWLYPTLVPTLQLPGSFEIPVRIADSAGNSTNASVTATITASLSAINIGLMPGENLISLPLIPDDAADGNLARLLNENLRVREITKSIWFYEANHSNYDVADRWVVYDTREEIPDDLVNLETGKGYWWITDGDLYEYSEPLPGLSQETPQVENFVYSGVFLRRGAQAPPVYDVVSGWNLVGFHSEKDLTANEYLSALGRGDSAGWSSLLRFDNFIDFPIAGQGEEREEPRFELGHFTRVFSAEEMSPTQGFWLYSTEEGVITP